MTRETRPALGSDGAAIVREVIERVTRRETALGTAAVEASLADTAYEELARLARARRSRRTTEERAWWRRIRRTLARGGKNGDDGASAEVLLEQVVARFAEEICGHFDRRVHALATRVIPHALSALLNTLSPRVLAAHFPGTPDLSRNLVVDGCREHLIHLARRGTIVLAPTHQSHLDSVVLGWLLHRLGLPPFTYGAGLNLYSNPLLSFFMHNLGAYRVDRKKTARLYKDTLKEYCTVTLERGHHNLFFPGGTRSRNGTTERRLKLGLLGCALRATIHNLQRDPAGPVIHIVPCAISYHLVLEAPTLIEEHLERTGRARFLPIEKDESRDPRTIFRFLANLVRLDARIHVTFGRAMDPLGNPVDDEGRSRDVHGRAIDVGRYLLVNGRPDHDPQRDAEYTREMGTTLSAALARLNTLMATHLVAFAVYGVLRSRRREEDLYRFLRTADEEMLPRPIVERALRHVLGQVRRRARAGEVRLDPSLAKAKPAVALDEALRVFATYGDRAPVHAEGAEVGTRNGHLLSFYRNRAAGYGLERDLDWPLDPA